MRCRVEYEFEFDFDNGEQYNQDILDCIEEDVPVAIQAAIDDIIDGVKCIGYKIVKL